MGAAYARTDRISSRSDCLGPQEQREDGPTHNRRHACNRSSSRERGLDYDPDADYDAGRRALASGGPTVQSSTSDRSRPDRGYVRRVSAEIRMTRTGRHLMRRRCGDTWPGMLWNRHPSCSGCFSERDRRVGEAAGLQSVAAKFPGYTPLPFTMSGNSRAGR